mmetsp:Transcript_13999/g.42362  ORF Transcript_13999/g.42362 Transcript_13999/m.42362 type:complete len:212 (+) Transcript_13999:1716-2351(+)
MRTRWRRRQQRGPTGAGARIHRPRRGVCLALASSTSGPLASSPTQKRHLTAATLAAAGASSRASAATPPWHPPTGWPRPAAVAGAGRRRLPVGPVPARRRWTRPRPPSEASLAACLGVAGRRTLITTTAIPVTGAAVVEGAIAALAPLGPQPPSRRPIGYEHPWNRRPPARPRWRPLCLGRMTRCERSISGSPPDVCFMSGENILKRKRVA